MSNLNKWNYFSKYFWQHNANDVGLGLGLGLGLGVVVSSVTDTNTMLMNEK